MKVNNLTSSKGNLVPNQFNIRDNDGNQYFQSYRSIIVKIDKNLNIYLDEYYWDYSRTTSKYRNAWLGMSTAEIKDGIKSGKIKLTNLNK